MLSKTKEFCREYSIVPTRTKGQNFLITESVYNDIIEAAELKKEDTILEVGPGLGFLTEKLAVIVEQVVAVELDNKLASVLQQRLVDVDNLTVFNENVLDMSIRNWKLETKKWQVVANLPYNITSVFLRKIFELKNKPEMLVLMLQKEVAERIVAKPGKMSLLAISVQRYAMVEIVRYVGKEHFWPMPEVDSAVLKIKTLPASKIDDDKSFFRLVKIGFSQKRKMLKNNLSNGFHISQEEAEEWITKAGFGKKVRAQELSVDDWERLLSFLKT